MEFESHITTRKFPFLCYAYPEYLYMNTYLNVIILYMCVYMKTFLCLFLFTILRTSAQQTLCDAPTKDSCLSLSTYLIVNRNIVVLPTQSTTTHRLNHKAYALLIKEIYYKIAVKKYIT